MSSIRVSAAAAVVVAGVFACATGLFVARGDAMLSSWLGQVIIVAVAAIVVALGLAAVLRLRMASALATVWLLALAFFAGVPALLAVALLALAGIALGSMALPDEQPAAPLFALAIGLVAIGGIVGWTLSWPIHHAWLHAPLLLAIVVVRRNAVLCAWRSARDGWQRAVAADPHGAACAMLVLGIVSVGAWLPTMQADDLAYHLALPNELQRWGAYAPDPVQQIWALAPWLGDVLQGIAQVIAAREARGALNVLWAAAAAVGAWSLARASASARGAPGSRSHCSRVSRCCCGCSAACRPSCRPAR